VAAAWRDGGLGAPGGLGWRWPGVAAAWKGGGLGGGLRGSGGLERGGGCLWGGSGLGGGGPERRPKVAAA
jgi:hypothetical protein